MQPHDVPHWIMQNQINKIESNDAGKMLGEIMKERGEVVMHRDGLRDRKQSLVLLNHHANCLLLRCAVTHTTHPLFILTNLPACSAYFFPCRLLTWHFPRCPAN